MLFGPVDRNLDKYRDIERVYKESLDKWICNLYFYVRRKDSIGKSYLENLIMDSNTELTYRKKSNTGKPLNAVKVSDSSYCKDYELEVVSVAKNEEEAFTARDTSLLQTTDRLISDEPKQVLIEEPKQKRKKRKDKYEKLIGPSDFDKYTYNIPHIELKSDTIVKRKFRYVMYEALSDLGFYNLRSSEFWISLLILLIVLWIRAFIHTFGSWIILKITGVSTDEFEPRL